MCNIEYAKTIIERLNKEEINSFCELIKRELSKYPFFKEYGFEITKVEVCNEKEFQDSIYSTNVTIHVTPKESIRKRNKYKHRVFCDGLYFICYKCLLDKEAKTYVYGLLLEDDIHIIRYKHKNKLRYYIPSMVESSCNINEINFNIKLEKCIEILE